MAATITLYLRSGGTIELNKDDVHTISSNNDKGSIVTVRQDNTLVSYEVYEALSRIRSMLDKP